MAMSVFLPSLWALGEGGQVPWAWLQKLAHRAVPGHLPWHLGKARGTRRGGGQCRMVEHWRQWASVAHRGGGSSRESLVSGVREIRVPSDLIPRLGDTGSPHTPRTSLRGVRVHRSSPLYLLFPLRSVPSAVPHVNYQRGRTG